MVVLPIFWDQHDNAQRVQETGFGIRLATYELDQAEVSSAVDGLPADTAVRDRAAAASARLRQRPGTVRAADLIERLAVTGEPVMR